MAKPSDTLMMYKDGNLVPRMVEAAFGFGQRPIYSREDLLNGFKDYAEWVTNNPLYKREIVKFKDHYEEVDIPVMRAMTITGFASFIGITFKTFNLYRKRAATAREAELIYDYITNQQYEGAAGNLLNPHIVSRMIGLTDKKEMTITNVDSLEESEVLNELKELQAELMGALSDDATRDRLTQFYGEGKNELDMDGPTKLALEEGKAPQLFPAAPTKRSKPMKKPRIIEEVKSEKPKPRVRHIDKDIDDLL